MEAFLEAAIRDISVPTLRYGSYRHLPQTASLIRATQLAELIGVTRLADITGLDSLGISVYQAVRPNSRNVSVSQGKGTSAVQAKVSALMESMESFHAERALDPSVFETPFNMEGRLDYEWCQLNAKSAHAGADRRSTFDRLFPQVSTGSDWWGDIRVGWLGAANIQTGKCSWVPRDLCCLDFRLTSRPQASVFRPSSNGLASGNTYAEAVLHALCEVLERDALARCAQAWSIPERNILTESVDDADCRALIDRLENAGVQLNLVNITGEAGVPSVKAFVHEHQAVYAGAGTHPDRHVAVIRAITEAAQGRLAHIAGSRDDLFRGSYFPGTSLSFPKPAGRLDDMVSVPVTTWSDWILEISRRIQNQTKYGPLVVDLTLRDIGVPVVFVIAPGLLAVPPVRQ